MSIMCRARAGRVRPSHRRNRKRRQHPRKALGQLGVRNERDQLILPQVHIALGEYGEIRRVRHGGRVYRRLVALSRQRPKGFPITCGRPA